MDTLEAAAAAVARGQEERPAVSEPGSAPDAGASTVEDAVREAEDTQGLYNNPIEEPTTELDTQQIPLSQLPSPPPHLAHRSAKLSALHARLKLPSRLPLTTLARSLIDRSADPDPLYNNESLALIGNDLLGNYMAEHLLVHYPRLPMAVLFAAQSAYVGPAALSSVALSWGVEAAASPGGEVDPGLLQFKRASPGSHPDDLNDINAHTTRPSDRNRRGDKVAWKRSMSSRIVHDDAFGDLQRDPSTTPPATVTLDVAATTFVRALAASIHLHAGSAASHAFFRAHILSRHLDLSSLFTFTEPTKDLSRLCAREGFEPPVARLESESGRLSRHPVFVVGVYSGRDRLGVDAGASLNEGRFRAAVKALKGWYLYSPSAAGGVVGVGSGAGSGDSGSGKGAKRKVLMPSQMEGEEEAEFKPAHVDVGEIVA